MRRDEEEYIMRPLLVKNNSKKLHFFQNLPL